MLSTIVEGNGEVQALPVLLRRLTSWRASGAHRHLSLATPIRVPRMRFLRVESEFRRHLLLAAHKSGPDGSILVLLDADDDCLTTFGPALQRRAQAVVP